MRSLGGWCPHDTGLMASPTFVSTLLLILVFSTPIIKSSALAGLIHSLRPNSNCSHAINFSLFQFSSHNRSTAIPYNSSVRAINVGSGTTATRLIHRIFCQDLGLKSMHWKSMCHGNSRQEVSARNELVEWSWKVTLCVYAYELEHLCPHRNASFGPLHDFCLWISSMNKLPSQRQCTSHHFLQRLQHYVVHVFSQIEAYNDTPADYLFGYLSPYLPSYTKIIQTLRDPDQWVLRRFNDHPYITKICRTHLSNSPGVNHPFDIVNCMQQTKYIGEALEIILPMDNVGTDSETSQRIRRAYIQMTSFNAGLARDPLMICLWDGHTENKSINSLRVKQEIREYFSMKIHGWLKSHGANSGIGNCLCKHVLSKGSSHTRHAFPRLQEEVIYFDKSASRFRRYSQGAIFWDMKNTRETGNAHSKGLWKSIWA